MPANRERRVPRRDHALEGHPIDFVDWEGAHLFLELVRRGSFRATAEQIGISFNAVRRRIAAFERSLGVTLITRHQNGIRLTPEGETILAAAHQMELAAFGLAHARDGASHGDGGRVKLAATEGLATYWLPPHLVEFQRANPKLMIDLITAMRPVDVVRLEADISVQLTRPTAKELIVVKLGCMHLVPFASQSYVDTYGTPESIADLANHRIVVQADGRDQAREHFDRLFPGVDPETFLVLRSNVSSSNYALIAHGGGIGLLPTYAYAIGASLVPIDLGLHLPVEIWMTYHPGAARIPRVRRLADWLIRVFAPKTFPWFRDEYIPPERLHGLYRGRDMHAPALDLPRGITAVG